MDENKQQEQNSRWRIWQRLSPCGDWLAKWQNMFCYLCEKVSGSILSWCGRRKLCVAVIVVLLALGILILALVSLWLCGGNSCQEIGGRWRIVQVWGYPIAWLTAVAGLGVAYMRSNAMAETARAQHKTAQAQHRTAEAQHDANEQEIYNTAVKNLGNENSSSARLGGIYGLLELAEKTLSRRENITEILCAHLRETTQNKDYSKDNSDQPSNEVQSLLIVLSRLNKLNQSLEETRKIQLNLRSAHLKGAVLSNANLQGADLSNAKLQGADLYNAKLQGARLPNVELQDATLMETQLQGTVLCSARLQGADLYNAKLQGADLSNAKLQGARLPNVELQGTDLSNADLHGADLSNANLHGANLYNAQLQEANLLDTQLQGSIAKSEGMAGSFEEWIKSRIEKESELETAVFSGGLNDQAIETIRKQLNDSGMDTAKAEELLSRLEQHKGEPDYTPPKDADTGTLTREMAAEIIAAYNEGRNQ